MGFWRLWTFLLHADYLPSPPKKKACHLRIVNTWQEKILHLPHLSHLLLVVTKSSDCLWPTWQSFRFPMLRFVVRALITFQIWSLARNTWFDATQQCAPPYCHYKLSFILKYERAWWPLWAMKIYFTIHDRSCNFQGEIHPCAYVTWQWTNRINMWQCIFTQDFVNGRCLPLVGNQMIFRPKY